MQLAHRSTHTSIRSCVVAIGIVLSIPAIGGAATEACPASPPPEEHEDTTPSGSPPRSFPLVAFAPCETVVVTLSADASASTFGAYLKVDIKNANGTILMTQGLACKGACEVQNPSLPPPGDPDVLVVPQRGTRGSSGHPASVTLTITSNSAPVPWTLTITRASRPGYNVGGLGLADAPLLSGFPATVKANLHNSESAGQYFRVRLKGSGTLQISGTGKASNYGSSLNARVYDAAGQQVGSLLTAKNIQTQTTFQSSVFTNPSSLPAEFYVRVYCQVRPIWDLSISFNAQEGPRLTLFLDADGNFDKNAPASEHEQFVPGSELSTGASASLPQALQLIAAFVDDTGHIVPVPYGISSVSFNLSGTSAFVGVAMNAGTSTAPDFQLGTTTVPFDNDNLASTSLACLDYGGFTTVTAADAGASVGFRLPRDANHNWLPDAGWRGIGWSAVTSSMEVVTVADGGQAAAQDNDGGAGTPGDGLSAFEEFRGFFVKGTHVRTTPAAKDLFIFSDVENGIGSAVNLPFAVHAIDAGELLSDTTVTPTRQRIVNANWLNGSLGSQDGEDIPRPFPQSGIEVREMGFNPNPDLWGHTFNGLIGSPNEQEGPISIFSPSIRAYSPPTKADPDTPDNPWDEYARKYILGHEIGHAVAISHAPLNPTYPPFPTSVMVASYLPPTDDISSPQWNNIPSRYDASDLQQIRLR